MINSFHKIKGAATLVIAILLVVLSTLIIIFAANHGQMWEKITANQTRNAESFSAAEAGLEYGINYLRQNSAVILANPVLGFILPFTNSSITNVTLANGSRFSIVYTNPVFGNYKLIKITSTGVNAEGTSTRVVSQYVAQNAILSNPGTRSLTTIGNVSLSGSAVVSNTSTNQTIQSGGTLTISGSAKTVTSTGTSSTAGNIQGDAQTSTPSLQSMSQSDFISQFFGISSTNALKNQMGYYYNNSANTNYSSTLSSISGNSIWIDQTGGTTATINGSTTIGSLTNPVLLVVNGNLSVSGNVTIYGFVFVIGSLGIDTLSGNTVITGGLASTSNLSISGNINLNYSPTVISNLQNQTNTSYWAKVPGTWKDF